MELVDSKDESKYLDTHSTPCENVKSAKLFKRTEKERRTFSGVAVDPCSSINRREERTLTHVETCTHEVRSVSPNPPSNSPGRDRLSKVP